MKKRYPSFLIHSSNIINVQKVFHIVNSVIIIAIENFTNSSVYEIYLERRVFVNTA